MHILNDVAVLNGEIIVIVIHHDGRQAGLFFSSRDGADDDVVRQGNDVRLAGQQFNLERE